jgi:hypothetical protein
MQQQAKSALATTNRQIKGYKREILRGKRRTILDKLKSLCALTITVALSLDKTCRRTVHKEKKNTVTSRLLKNLYSKFLSESVKRKITYSFLCRLKPFYIRHPT